LPGYTYIIQIVKHTKWYYTALGGGYILSTDTRQTGLSIKEMIIEIGQFCTKMFIG